MSKDKPQEGGEYPNIIAINSFRARFSDIGIYEGGPVRFGTRYEFCFTPQSVAIFCLRLIGNGKITEEQAAEVMDAVETSGSMFAIQKLASILQEKSSLRLVPPLTE